MLLQATSIEEKFRLRFFPTLKLHTSENCSSPIENTLKTEISNKQWLSLLDSRC